MQFSLFANSILWLFLVDTGHRCAICRTNTSNAKRRIESVSVEPHQQSTATRLWWVQINIERQIFNFFHIRFCLFTAAYFSDDATIYAQIDHNKSVTANNASSLSAPNGQLLNNSLNDVDRNVSGGGGQIIREHNSHFNPMISPLSHPTSSSINYHNVMSNSSNSTNCINNPDTMGVTSSAPTATFTSIPSNQFPPNTFQHLSLGNVNKQYLHDMVARSPLSFSEQESCV